MLMAVVNGTIYAYPSVHLEYSEMICFKNVVFFIGQNQTLTEGRPFRD